MLVIESGYNKMNILNNELYLEDLALVINEFSDLFSKLENKKILITAAGGLIPSAVVDLCIRYNEKTKNKIQLLCAARDKEKLIKRFLPYSNNDYFTYINYDATKQNDFDFDCDYIIHAASNASPNFISEQPVETMVSNFNGLKELLDFAKNKNVINTLFISSSEIYGKKETPEPYREDDYGYIDILNPRNSYPISKKAGETLCISYSEEYNIHINIVRPGHIYGPSAKKSDARVGSSFAYLAAEGKDIVMKSDGSQIRSYCHSLDCASAILYILVNGENAEAYNISNPNSIMSIKELAQLYAEAGNVNLIIQEASTEEKAIFNPMHNSSLNSDKLINLGWKGLFDKDRGTMNTVKILKTLI